MLGLGSTQVGQGESDRPTPSFLASTGKLLNKKDSAEAEYFSGSLIVLALEDLRYGIADRAVAVPNTRTQRADYQNDDKYNKRKNDSVLDKTLTLFLWCK
jgi:hypothetical protein